MMILERVRGRMSRALRRGLGGKLAFTRLAIMRSGLMAAVIGLGAVFAGSVLAQRSATSLADAVVYCRSGSTADSVKTVLVQYQKSTVTSEVDTATYYLARWYHQKYEATRNGSLFTTARELYHKCIRRYEPARGAPRAGEWLSDARFYKSLLFLRMNDLTHAKETIRDLNPTLDSSIDIDLLPGSSKGTVAVNATFLAAGVKAGLMEIYEKYSETEFSESLSRQILRDFADWCKENSPAPTKRRTPTKRRAANVGRGEVG